MAKTFIKGSEKSSNGEITILFKGGYYAHSIQSVGITNDAPDLFTMWGWINHLRSKNWWNGDIEQSFIREVSKLL